MTTSTNWIIGAAPTCDLVIDEATVSSRHCRLSREGERLLIEDLGSTNGTFVNGRQISGATPVTSADTIRLATDVELRWSRLQPLAATRVLRVGRDPDNDVVIDRPTVSGQHARLLVGPDRVTVIDLGSTNGTSLGRPDNRVVRAEVARNDTLFLGSEPFPVSQLLQPQGPSRPRPSAGLVRHPWAAAVVPVACVLLLAVWALRGARTDTGRIETSSPGPPRENDPIVEERGSTPTVGMNTAAKGLYSLIVKTHEDEPGLRIGTAWAVGQHQLATCGSLATFLERSRDEFPVIQVVGLEAGPTCAVTGWTVHPACASAIVEADRVRDEMLAAREQLAGLDETAPGETAPTAEEIDALTDRILSLEDQWFVLTERMVHHDVALLDVEESLPIVLSMANKPPPRLAAVRLAGAAFPHDASIVTGTRGFAASEQACSLESLVRAEQAGIPRLLVRCPTDLASENWLGAPLLDEQGEVIATLLPPDAVAEAQRPPGRGSIRCAVDPAVARVVEVRRSSSMNRLLCLVLLSLLSCVTMVTHAQNPQVRTVVIDRGSRGWNYSGWHSPLDALSARVHAQADLVRATGEATVDFAVAREIRAHAVRQELVNSVDRVKAYWERRRIGEEEIRKRRVDPLTRRRRQNGKTWERLKNHPELNGPAIAKGESLNFLMYRLLVNGAAIDSSDSQSGFDAEALAYFALPPDVLHDLRLQQNTATGDRHIFRADEGTPLDVGWWPYVLRGEEFAGTRDQFVQARQATLRDAEDGQLEPRTLEELELALVDLSTEYREHFTRERRIREGVKGFQQTLAADAFLQSLDLEIARLQSTGDASTFDDHLRFDPGQDGGHLLALLQFMARNGLEFGPAQPGDESAYHTVFQQLRDLYLAVAENDESIASSSEEQPAP